ncbi:hypothetical protein [Dyella sp. 2RAB6]|uniref:hypothetical protein n=1 Tax=Dyella sp. 2RAB6 TaxID=3232992 RepID=UPI003F8F488C
MGLLDKLFGKKSRDTDAPAPAASNSEAQEGGDIVAELAPALKAHQDGRHDEAVAIASPYVDQFADANRLCALARSAQQRYLEAFPYWLALFQQEPSAHNALQLATTSVMCGEVHRGEAWLMKFDEINQESSELSPVTARTNFISALDQRGLQAEALPHLSWVRDVYAHVRITDSHFLWTRGIPFFPGFLERSLPILQASLPAVDICRWYGELTGKLDEEGEAQLGAWMQRLAAPAGS